MKKEAAYTLRELKAKDAFRVTAIIDKIGISEFGSCFKSDNVMKAIGKKSSTNTIGITVGIDIAGIICKNLGKCEKDIYSFLSDLSGMKEDAIAELPLGDFSNMIVDVIELDGFKDFIQAASRFFK